MRGINHGPDGDSTLPPIDIPLSAVVGNDDSAETYDEHFWNNIRYLIGDSISNQLARMPAEIGTVTV